jgi:hypothetical protein
MLVDLEDRRMRCRRLEMVWWAIGQMRGGLGEPGWVLPGAWGQRRIAEQIEMMRRASLGERTW